MRDEFQADLDEVSRLLVAMADEVRAAMQRATDRPARPPTPASPRG